MRHQLKIQQHELPWNRQGSEWWNRYKIIDSGCVVPVSFDNTKPEDAWDS